MIGRLLFNAKSGIFLTISWREQIAFQPDDDDVLFALGQQVLLDFYSASSVKPKFTGKCMSPHSETLSRFHDNQSSLLLHNTASLAENQQIQIA